MKQRATLIIYCLTSFLCAYAQKPVADFKSDISGGCSPIVVNFQDLSTGNPTSWLWEFGNGAFSTLKNPSTTYFAPGTYSVKMTAMNASGSHTVTKTTFITVYEDPKAEFSSNVRNGCSPFKIQFRDQSSTPSGTKVTQWKWDFGDGGSSTEQNPQYIYRSSGSFTVTLTITNDKGCSHLITKPNFIDIIPGVSADFSSSDPAVCTGPTPINFVAQASGPGTLSYFWDFGDGQTSTQPQLTHNYGKDGAYKVTLAVTSSAGCSDTLKDRIINIGGIQTNFSVPGICAKNEVQFMDSSSITPDYSIWRFSDGTTDSTQFPYKIFNSPGTYDVTLINIYTNCKDSITKKITIAPLPQVDFTADVLGSCQGPLTVNFRNNTKDAVSFKWEFGDGATSTEKDPRHTYTSPGIYNVSLIAYNASGCPDTLVKGSYIRVEKPYIAAINLPTSGCVPFIFSPNASIASPDSVVSYRWDFGDGGTSDLKTPQHTYTRQGTYTVKLTVTTNGGCSETFTLSNAVKVGTLPAVNFTFDKNNVCASDPISFTDQSAPADEWMWSFGDGEFAYERNPVHVFANVGTLTVLLKASNNGCPDSVKKQVTVKTPVAKFAYMPNCDNRLQYTFTDKSIEARTWEWDFGDGSAKYNGQNPPTHSFPSFGTYNVSLRVTNGECSYVITRTIEVARFSPQFTINSQSACQPLAASFVAADADNPRIRNFTWNFGDGSVVTTTGKVNYIFRNPGVFDVSLTTTDTFGCTETFVNRELVRVLGPKANFSSTTNQGCRGMTTEFKDESTTQGGRKIASWTWDFGDGTRQTFSAPPFQHTYSKVGRYTVKLVVQDDAGCKDSVTIRNFVRTSTFKVAQGNYHPSSCPGADVNFFNIVNTRNYQTLWDFGDGGTSNMNNVTYRYKDTGTYTIKLVITDTLGCKDSVIKTNHMRVYYPVANFTANNLTTYCTPFEAKFTNTSTNVSAVFWDLSIGTSQQYHPTSYYTKTGTYDIKLKIFGHGGCTDSVTKTLRVYNPSDGKLTYSPQLGGCRPFPVDFAAFSEMSASFVWDFGDGTVIDTSVNEIRHVYDNFGNFLPKIILKEPSGCLVPLTGSSVIEIIGAKAKFEVNQFLFCDSGMVVITDSTTSREPISEYLWNFGDGTTSTSMVPEPHYYNTPGHYPLSLVVKTETGCTDTMRLQPPVKIVESPLVGILGDSSVCLNEFNVYRGNIIRPDTSLLRWNWVFGNGNSSTSQLPVAQQYGKDGPVTITATATNSSGCKHTATRNIFVHPLPSAILPATITTQVGFPAPIPITYSSNVTTYNWTPSVGLNCTDCPQPIAGPKYNTKYTVTYIDSNECRNTSEVQLIVLCKDANVFVPNTFTPNGDGVNDVFYVRGKGLDRVKSLRIFNRWGEVVFEKKDFPVNQPSVGWNGVYKGSRAMSGVYIYQVEVFCENSEVIRFEGNITLIQ